MISPVFQRGFSQTSGRALMKNSNKSRFTHFILRSVWPDNYSLVWEKVMLGFYDHLRNVLRMLKAQLFPHWWWRSQFAFKKWPFAFFSVSPGGNTIGVCHELRHSRRRFLSPYTSVSAAMIHIWTKIALWNFLNDCWTLGPSIFFMSPHHNSNVRTKCIIRRVVNGFIIGVDLLCAPAGRLSMDSSEGDVEVGCTVLCFHEIACVRLCMRRSHSSRTPSSSLPPSLPPPPPPPPPSPGLWESPLLPLILLQDPPTPTAELRHTHPVRLGEMDTLACFHVKAVGSSSHALPSAEVILKIQER